MTQTIQGKLYLTIAFILAGSSVIAAYFVSAYLPPFTITFLSLFFASLTAIIFCGRQMLVTAAAISQKTWAAIFAQALFGSFLFRIFLITGLQYIGTTEAGIITGATPAITALFALVILREKLNQNAVIGILLTLTGILLVQGFPIHIVLKKSQFSGVILVLCAAACESLFTILSRKLCLSISSQEKLPAVIQAGLVSILAMVLCLIPMLTEHSWQSIAILPPSGWLALIWYGSVITIVAFACMFAGAKRCDGYTIAAYAGIVPLSSTVLSVLLLKAPINRHKISGCILVIAATIIISNKKIIRRYN